LHRSGTVQNPAPRANGDDSRVICTADLGELERPYEPDSVGTPSGNHRKRLHFPSRRCLNSLRHKRFTGWPQVARCLGRGDLGRRPSRRSMAWYATSRAQGGLATAGKSKKGNGGARSTPGPGKTGIHIPQPAPPNSSSLSPHGDQFALQLPDRPQANTQPHPTLNQRVRSSKPRRRTGQRLFEGSGTALGAAKPGSDGPHGFAALLGHRRRHAPTASETGNPGGRF
jgi:hypothetical protein